ncbi:MAG: peptidylprolyl isomerase [Acidobacteria bacterium]|nr:peptidylprolyl isomerase [Acidobacteriota bacterium]
MLNVFRQNLRHLKWVLYLVAISFVVTLFWQGGTTQSGAGQQSWAARVDGRSIPNRRVQTRATNLDSLYRQTYGAEQYALLRDGIDLIGLALDYLIDEEILIGEANRLGIRVSDQEVQERIRNFQGLQEGGQFIGKERYLEMVRQGQIDAVQFEEGIRREILLETVRGLMQDGIQISEAEVLDEFRRQNERLSAEYLLVTPDSAASQIEVSQEEIESTYRIRQEAYREPERRLAAFLEILLREVGETIEPTDEEVYAYHQENLLTKYTLKDQRRASHILFRVAEGASEKESAAAEQKARQVLQSIRSGEDFAELAKTNSDDGSAQKGGDLGYFGKNRMVPEFEKAAWELEVGEVSDLVRTQFGFHIIKVLDTQSQRVQSLEEVRDKIRSLLRFRMTLEEVSRQVKRLRERMEGPESFRRVAEEAGITIRETGPVSADGQIEGAPNSRSMVRAIFSMETGQISDPIAGPSSQGLILLRKIVPGEIPELQEVRDQVEKDARKQKVFDWITEWVDGLRTASPPGTIADLATELEVEKLEATEISRGSPLPDLPETGPLLAGAFDLQEGQWLGPRLLQDGRILLLQVTEKQGNLEELDIQKELIRRTLLFAKRDTHYRSLLLGLRARSRIETNPTNLAGNQITP